MGKESRVIQLQKDLVMLGCNDSLRALNWMIETMNAKNGYARHDGSNYYFHLVDATQDLINSGITDGTTLTACILHDAPEDISWVNYDDISSEYGVEVANIVDLVTKKDGVDYKDGANLKSYLQRILSNEKASLVKTADRKHNFSTLEHAKPEKELRQALETERYFIPFFKEARKRYPQYSNYFHSAKTIIVPHLNKIKKYHRDIAELKAYITELEKMAGVK